MLTTTDYILLIPLFVFALYSSWVTAGLVFLRGELREEKFSHERTTAALNTEARDARTYRQALMFYAEESNWDPIRSKNAIVVKPSTVSYDQGQTAKTALGGYFSTGSLALFGKTP